MADAFSAQFSRCRQYVARTLNNLARAQTRLTRRIDRLVQQLDLLDLTLDQLFLLPERQRTAGVRTLIYEAIASRREETRLRESRFRLTEFRLELGGHGDKHETETS